MGNINWWDKLIEVVITLGATFAGVWLAFLADNKREANDNNQRKIRLVKALFAEISELEKFFTNTEEISEKKSYNIETHVVVDTVQDQINYLESMELILKLSGLRRFAGTMSKRFESLENAYVQSSTNINNISWQRQVDGKKNAWNGERVFALRLIGEIKDLLSKEIPNLN